MAGAPADHVAAGRGMVASVAVELAAGAYLLTSDNYLKLSGNSLHWYGLLVFSVVSLLLLILLLVRPGRGLFVATGIWSAVGVAAILGDASSGLALSSFHSSMPYEGWKYLFGLGQIQGAGSVFGTSLAVWLLLISSAISTASGLLARA